MLECVQEHGQGSGHRDFRGVVAPGGHQKAVTTFKHFGKTAEASTWKKEGPLISIKRSNERNTIKSPFRCQLTKTRFESPACLTPITFCQEQRWRATSRDMIQKHLEPN